MSFFKTLTETIQAFDTIIIHRHQNPDPDALGSQLGLASLIKDNFQKEVYAVGFDAASLAYIGQMDQVSDQQYQDALVIVTDTANTPRIDDKRYLTGAKLIKIDHHPNVDNYGDLAYVDTTASSASEIIGQYALDQGLTISNKTAALLYTGIVGDTGRFLYPSTSQKTMALVAHLRQYDFDAATISDRMMTRSLATAKLCGYVLQELTISPAGVSYVIINQDLLDAYGLTDEHTVAVIGQPATVEGVLCWCIFVEQPNGTYRCRIRSKGPAINEIAADFDGGGHPLASGANAKDYTEILALVARLEAAASAYKNQE